jgi:hypothetical protein
MTDDDSEEPAVTLGAGQAVEGAPLARVSARLMWGIEKSAVREREGETLIRTPDGPTELETLLTDVDKQYFSTRQEFEAALSDVIGDGAVPVESDDSGEAADSVDEPTDTDSNDESADAEESDDEPADAEDGSDETVEAEDADGESAEADDATADEEVAFDSDSE